MQKQSDALSVHGGQHYQEVEGQESALGAVFDEGTYQERECRRGKGGPQGKRNVRNRPQIHKINLQ